MNEPTIKAHRISLYGGIADEVDVRIRVLVEKGYMTAEPTVAQAIEAGYRITAPEVPGGYWRVWHDSIFCGWFNYIDSAVSYIRGRLQVAQS